MRGTAHAAVQAILLAIAISIVLGTIGSLLATRLLALMGASPEVIGMGTGYARIMLGGEAAIIVLFVVNAIFREFGPDDASGHQFIYSLETLAERLRAAGFTDVRRCEVGESAHAMLRGIERHADAVGDGRVVRYETLVVEATRPAAARDHTDRGGAHG